MSSDDRARCRRSSYVPYKEFPGDPQVRCRDRTRRCHSRMRHTHENHSTAISLKNFSDVSYEITDSSPTFTTQKASCSPYTYMTYEESSGGRPSSERRSKSSPLKIYMPHCLVNFGFLLLALFDCPRRFKSMRLRTSFVSRQMADFLLA